MDRSPLRGVLGQAANGAARTQTFLGERYHRIVRCCGTAKAKAQAAVAQARPRSSIRQVTASGLGSLGRSPSYIASSS